MGLLKGFSDKALQVGYNRWESLDFHDYAELAESFKAVRNASDVDSSFSVSTPVSANEKLPRQHLRPAQRPGIDLQKLDIVGG